MAFDKKEAVTRLVAQSVKLHFNDGDDYATHLLLMSAFRIARDIIVKNTPFDDFVARVIKPEHLKDALTVISKTSNFLKHADNDADAMLDTDIDIRGLNELLIVMVSKNYELAFDAVNKNLLVHFALLIITKANPHLLLSPIEGSMAAFLAGKSEEELRNDLKTCIRHPEELSNALVDARQRGWVW
jgi:hypothetical protein